MTRLIISLDNCFQLCLQLSMIKIISVYKLIKAPKPITIDQKRLANYFIVKIMSASWSSRDRCVGIFPITCVTFLLISVSFTRYTPMKIDATNIHPLMNFFILSKFEALEKGYLSVKIISKFKQMVRITSVSPLKKSIS